MRIYMHVYLQVRLLATLALAGTFGTVWGQQSVGVKRWLVGMCIYLCVYACVGSNRIIVCAAFAVCVNMCMCGKV
jgi:hypothetical protein